MLESGALLVLLHIAQAQTHRDQVQIQHRNLLMTGIRQPGTPRLKVFAEIGSLLQQCGQPDPFVENIF